MNWKKDNTESDDAVTSVVGEILLMALVIILVSLFAASAFDLLPGDRQSAVDVSMSYDKTNKILSFWHKGGDWIAGDDLAVTLTAAQEKRCRNGNSFSVTMEPGTYRVYSQAGEFLALSKVESGVMSTIKSFFEV